jgi:hypothetical protein
MGQSCCGAANIFFISIRAKMLAIRHRFTQNPLAVVAQKAQSSGGLVKIWPGEIARPFFFASHENPR